MLRRDFIRSCGEPIEVPKIYPGVRETLVALQLRGTGLAVVTNLPSWIVEPLLERVELTVFFDIITCAAAKPRPQGIRATLAKLESDPACSYHVGDTAADALAAERTPVPFAWASYGYGDPGRCRAVGPDHIITTIEQLPALVRPSHSFRNA